MSQDLKGSTSDKFWGMCVDSSHHCWPTI